MDDLSIFVTAHMTNEATYYALQLCITNIRNHYENNRIFIINDNSKFPVYTDNFKNKELITVIDSDFKGAGESLFLYYYHKMENPSKKAIYIHDSMFLISPIPKEILDNLTTVKFLLSFDKKFKIKEQEDYISKLNEGSLINENQNWVGCYGGACIMTHEYLTKLQNNYNITSIVPFITCRSQREMYERILGSVVSYDLNKNPDYNMKEEIAIYGDLYEYFEIYPTGRYHHFNYLHMNKEELPPLLKLNFGR